MTSRERVYKAIRHDIADRVPIDFGAMRSTGIMSIAYNLLKEKLGLRRLNTRMYDLVQQLAYPDNEILDRFQIDVVDLGNIITEDMSLWKDGNLPDGSKCKVPYWFNPVYNNRKKRLEVYDTDGDLIGVMPDGCLYFEQSLYPLADGNIPSTIEELREKMAKVIWAYLPCSPWDRAKEDNFWEWLKNSAKKARASTERAIMMGFGGNLLEWGQMLCSNENFLVMLAAEPKKAEKLLDMLTEVHLQDLEKVIQAVDGAVDILQMGDDLGMQKGMQISPEMYRRFFKPRHKKIYHYVKDNSSMFVFLHSCGSIYPVIADLIEAGVDIINPVQTSAKDMNPERLKSEFGKYITFWGGGCETQEVLWKGTPKDVEKQVKERMEIMSPGGGFVFNQVHNIMANVPPENVIALFEAALKYGEY
ncbi:methyltransferase [Candidatus Aerophobetes bacterium]|nr:methyltransferase [Candidatus Aerophobetes bacterium]